MIHFHTRKERSFSELPEGVAMERRQRVEGTIHDRKVSFHINYGTLKWAGGGLFAVLVVAYAAGWVKYGKAEELTLYPKSCLGGWHNPAGASGVPDVLGHAAADFNETNSAWVSDSLSQIYCGSFQGDIPVNTSPTKITVHLSWAIRGPLAVASSSPNGSGSNPNPDTASGTGTSTPVVITDDSASSTNTILNTLENVPSMLLIPIQNLFDQSSSTQQNPPDTVGTPPAQNASSTPTPAASDTPPAAPPATSAPDSTPAPAPDAAPAPSATPTPVPPPAPDAPQSLRPIRSFFSWLFVPETALADTTDPSASSSPNGANTDATATATDTPDTVPTPPATANTNTVNDVLEVLYTLDGTTWQSLGTVSADQLTASSTFEIPLENVQNWGDLSNVQISVRSLSGISAGSTVYLDGMQLEVGYGPTRADVAAAQVEKKEAAHVAYVASLPTKNLSVTLGASTDPELSLNRETNGDGKEEVVIRAPQGSLAIYSDSDPGFSVAVGVGDQPVHLPAYTFPPADYTVIATTEPNACQQLTKEACQQEAHFLASAQFSVSDLHAGNEATTTP